MKNYKIQQQYHFIAEKLNGVIKLHGDYTYVHIYVYTHIQIQNCMHSCIQIKILTISSLNFPIEKSRKNC